MFRSLLVANRGEIAVRIIRTCRRLGIRSVLAAAIPDRTSLAARSADEVVLLPGASATDTYLNIDALIDAARRAGCEALHPGYGFLSESPALARACASAGITFVGPSPESLELLGDKTRARDLATSLGIPVIPGWQQDTGDDAAVADAAETLGFPVMLKARAGGGGRGMRRLLNAAGLLDTIAAARREARASFGDDGLFLEKLIESAHHVEVQVLGDAAGNVLHFGERDCSVQRRHQKLIEESPSPAVDAALRTRITADAVRLCEAASYRNAGTVEFLVTGVPASGEPPYYLLEVNPRLQVEHPVTEVVTGVDLVELQLRVAAGEPLDLAQFDIRFTGAAIELRINAESPLRGFEPSPGRVDHRALPPAVRIDPGYAAGDNVPAQFDSLFLKLIAHGTNRPDALRLAREALTALHIAGPATNATFLDRVLASRDFVAGEATIDWLDAHIEDLLSHSKPDPVTVAAAAGALATPGHQPFANARWIGAGGLTMWLWDGETTHPVIVDSDASGAGAATVDGSEVPLPPPGHIHSNLDREDGRVSIDSPPGRFTFTLVSPLPLPRSMRPTVAAGATVITAPLAGTIAAVHVQPGQSVAPGDPLVTLEAMKMEHRLTADAQATVAAVHATQGAVVARGDPLVELAPP